MVIAQEGGATMPKSTKSLCLLTAAVGGLLGCAAAAGHLTWGARAQAAPQDRESAIPFEVLVPAGTTLEIGGYKTTEAGTERHFDTPPLKVGGTYTYAVKATFQGKEV